MSQPKTPQVRKSISRKLVGLVLASLGVACAVTALISAGMDVRRQTATEVERLNASAAVVASLSSEAVAAGDRARAFRAIRAIANMPGLNYARLETSDGVLLAETGGGVRLVRDARLEGDATPGMLDLLRTRSIEVAAPVVNNGETVGRLVLFSEAPGIRSRILATVIATLIGAIVASLAGLLVALRLGRAISRPIGGLAGVIAEVRDSHDYAARAEIEADGEVAELVEGFNDLLTTIQARDEQIAAHVANLESTVAERTAELRLAKTAAEEASAAKSDFLAAMSHEIRTPMNGVLALSELLAGSSIPPRERRYAEVIAKSGRSLLSIINDILDFSKVEAGKIDLESIEVDLCEAAEDVAGLFAERARAKGLEIATFVDPRTPLVQGDPTRLRQVIGNLVNNAVKFTEQGGVLIEIEPDPDAAGHIRIGVRDTGIGIPQEKLPTLFEAFTQADQSTTRKFGGTGLGLAICDRFVRAMGAEWRLSSTVGQGSTFAFSLPATAAEPAEPLALAGHPSFSLHGLSDLMRDSLARYLRAYGCEVVQRGEYRLAGIEAVRARACPPERTIAVCQGDIDGYELVRDGLAAAVLLRPVARHDLEALLAAAGAGTDLRKVAQEARRGARTLPRFDGLQVLVADDSEVNREVAVEALSRLGVVPALAKDGREAVEMAERRRFDLILMDGSMPELDGFEASRRIREFEAAEGREASRILALTAHVVGSGADAWRGAGMDGVIHKPFTLPDLAAALLRLFEPAEAEAPEIAPAAEATPTDEAAAPAAEADDLAIPTLAGAELFDPVVRGELEAMAAAGRSAFVARVEGLYRDNAPPVLFRMIAALEAGDLKTAGREAHALKSMSLSLGAGLVAAQCATVEARADAGRPLDGEEMREVAAAFQATLAGLTAPAAEAA